MTATMSGMEESEPQDHLLVLAEKRYLLSHDPLANKDSLVKEIMQMIEEENMLPYYQYLLEHDPKYFKANKELSNKMKHANDEKLKELDDKITDAEENFGESEVREALLTKAQYFARIGDKEKALAAYRLTSDKTVSLGQRLDIVFAILRIAFAFNDLDLLNRNIEKAKSLIEEGGDWERRNKLKVYEGTYQMIIRNFKTASDLFLESVSTFSSTELMPYNTFIFYTILVAMISLDRPDIKKKVIVNSDILTVINQIPHAFKFVDSLYNSKYRDFLVSLADISDSMRKDRYTAPHVLYYTRELRIKAYSQFLESYKSVTLKSMANDFGLSVRFLDDELSRFIASSRLNAKIDKVGGIIETNRYFGGEKNSLYHQTIKHGDQLLNRIQKLSRVIDL
jgi:26S proteasome regulatory subunit N7